MFLRILFIILENKDYLDNLSSLSTLAHRLKRIYSPKIALAVLAGSEIKCLQWVTSERFHRYYLNVPFTGKADV
jgi:hypothetical protein